MPTTRIRPTPGSRHEWVEVAADYAVEHGLIGLSLRPLAAALGTSDRMLIYRFGNKDALVAEILRESTARATGHLARLPRSADARAAVHDLWAAVSDPDVNGCHRLYVEAAALGLFGREPYASVGRETNDVWHEAVVEHLRRSGVADLAADRIATLVDAAFVGLRLDLPLQKSPPDGDVGRTVEDLASAAALLSGA